MAALLAKFRIAFQVRNDESCLSINSLPSSMCFLCKVYRKKIDDTRSKYNLFNQIFFCTFWTRTSLRKQGIYTKIKHWNICFPGRDPPLRRHPEALPPDQGRLQGPPLRQGRGGLLRRALGEDLLPPEGGRDRAAEQLRGRAGGDDAAAAQEERVRRGAAAAGALHGLAGLHHQVRTEGLLFVTLLLLSVVAAAAVCCGCCSCCCCCCTSCCCCYFGSTVCDIYCCCCRCLLILLMLLLW